MTADRLAAIRARLAHPTPQAMVTWDDVAWLIARAQRLEKALRGVSKSIHLGSHEGPFNRCAVWVCDRARAALEDSEPEHE